MWARNWHAPLVSRLASCHSEVRSSPQVCIHLFSIDVLTFINSVPQRQAKIRLYSSEIIEFATISFSQKGQWNFLKFSLCPSDQKLYWMQRDLWFTCVWLVITTEVFWKNWSQFILSRWLTTDSLCWVLGLFFVSYPTSNIRTLSYY